MNPNYKINSGNQVTSTQKQRPTRFGHPDGTVYRVGKGGAWIRETARRCDTRDRKGLHNNSVRRRLK